MSGSLSFEHQSSPIHRYVVFYIKEEKSIVVESVGEQKHEILFLMMGARSFVGKWVTKVHLVKLKRIQCVDVEQLSL